MSTYKSIVKTTIILGLLFSNILFADEFSKKIEGFMPPLYKDNSSLLKISMSDINKNIDNNLLNESAKGELKSNNYISIVFTMTF